MPLPRNSFLAPEMFILMQIELISSYATGQCQEYETVHAVIIQAPKDSAAGKHIWQRGQSGSLRDGSPAAGSRSEDLYPKN